MKTIPQVHCRTCIHLKNYKGEQGWNPISKAGWCNLRQALRYAQVTRKCDEYKVYNFFKEGEK